MMAVEGLDAVMISKLTSQQVEQVTCAECCKYFIAPETAACGHSLCHSCWKGRRNCPTCAAPVLKKALKVNSPLQTLTEHIYALADSFRKLFKENLEDFSFELLDDPHSADPAKNVKEWLASSQNHFSAAVLSTQNSALEQEIPVQMELTKSHFQVHTINKKTRSPKKVVQSPLPQEDWDKIQVLPDIEEDAQGKTKEPVISSMDIEPFLVDDYEYTSTNPRRSSRKKESHTDSNPPTREVTDDKISGKNSSETKSLKSKQNWSNVKKMKKEFSKLTRRKENKNKLNVSIEMAKRAAAATKAKQKSGTPTPQTSSEKNVNIDECTPAAICLDKIQEVVTIEQTSDDKKSETYSEKDIAEDIVVKYITVDKHTSEILVSPKSKDNVEKQSNKEKRDTINNLKEPVPKEQSNNKKRDLINTPKEPDPNEEKNKTLDENEVPNTFENQKQSQRHVPRKNFSLKEDNFDNNNAMDKPAKMPFLKKGALCVSNKIVNNDNVEVTHKEIDSNKTARNTDDIEISIRIGNTVTNIVIKNKMKDVQMKVNTDQEIQADLGPYKLIEQNDAGNSPIPELHVENIEENTNIEKQDAGNSPIPNIDDNKVNEKKDTASSPIKELMVRNIALNIEGKNKISINKSLSTKKNTASADTATAQFDITDSMERELSDVMECLERKRTRSQISQNTQKLSKLTKNVAISPNIESSKKYKSSNSKKSDYVEPEIESVSVKKIKVQENVKEKTEDPNNLNDIDIFNSGSVKEGHNEVKLLKDTRYAASEIIVPSLRNKRTQRSVEKRDRETNDDELPTNKKQKINLDLTKDDQEEIRSQVSETQEKNAPDSEPMNYDIIMSQVFANIDADIQNSSKNKNVNKTTEIYEHDNENVIDKPTDSSQIVHKTQNIRHQKDDSLIEKCDESKENDNQEYSGNVFSMLEKDSEPVEKVVSGPNNDKGKTSTQQHIDNLLTPGMCKDLVATHDSQMSQKHDSQTSQRHDSQTSIFTEKHDEIIAVPCTPNIDDDDFEKSIVEETPQKNSFTKPKQTDVIRTKSINKKQTQKENSSTQENAENKETDAQIIKSIINISDSTIKEPTIIDLDKNRHTLETPGNIKKFVNHIKHNSTPVARKSLNFESENMDEEPTLCPTTTQEKQFLSEAFKQTPASPIKRPLALKNSFHRQNRKLYVAGSCLSLNETKSLKMLCQERGWTYLDKYSKDLTHLVVGVDEDNKSQRSVKYMCALAASKWIVSYTWVEKCLQQKTAVDEHPFEALDACGEPGPRRSRTAIKKVFEGMVFYCMPPFSVLGLDTLKSMLIASGGRVVEDPSGVKVSRHSGSQVRLLLAEPEHTQEDRFVYLAMEHSVVPVNYEWALNCLGSYTLSSIYELLLCPSSLLPPTTASWPAVLLSHDDDDDYRSPSTTTVY